MTEPTDTHDQTLLEPQKKDLRFRLVTEAISDVFWMSTQGVGKMIYISPAYETLWERSIEALYRSPQSFLQALHPDDLDNYLKVVETYHARGLAYECEYRIIRNNGAIRWIHERGFPVADLWDGEQLMTGICTDITERKSNQETLAQLLRQHELILKSASEGIYGIDLHGTVTFVNSTATELLGWSSAELIGHKLHGMIHHSLADGTPYAEKDCQIYRTLVDGQPRSVENEHFWHKDGSSFPVEYASSAILEGDTVVGAVVTFRDISKRVQAEMKIKFLASYDTLTKLPNRTLFMDRLEQAMTLMLRDEKAIAVMFIDLDEFKAVNDQFGHAAGDDLLREMAARMQERLRRSDTVARIGGDEFSIILNEAGDRQQVEAIARQIVTALSRPHTYEGQELVVGASIGIILCSGDRKYPLTATQALQRADKAMYIAKREGKGRYHIAAHFSESQKKDA